MTESTLKKLVREYIENSQYEKAASLVQDELEIGFKVEFKEHGFHFQDDKYKRDIYIITLSRGTRSYSIKFGQSIFNSGKEPTIYSVLSCLTKHDPGDLQNFCDEFGYDIDSKKAEKIYNAVLDEFNNMKMLFCDYELEILQGIS